MNPLSTKHKHSTGVAAKQPACGLFTLLRQKFYCQHNWPLMPWWQWKALKICLSTLLEVVDACQTKGGGGAVVHLTSWACLCQPHNKRSVKGGLRTMGHTCLSLKALLAKSEWDHLELYWKKVFGWRFGMKRKSRQPRMQEKQGCYLRE